MDNTVTVVALTALVTSLASKGAEGPARTINLLWKATLGRWDKPLEKYIERRDSDKEKYAEEILKETNKIPADNIKPEADISIIGPALEASNIISGMLYCEACLPSSLLHLWILVIMGKFIMHL